MATRLQSAEQALAQAETAVGTLHSTVEVLADAEAAVARARRRLPRLRTVLVVGLGIGIAVVVVKLAARRRQAQVHIAAFDEVDLRTEELEPAEAADLGDPDSEQQ